MFNQTVTGQITGNVIESFRQESIPFTVTQFSTKQGLPQNQVSKILACNSNALVIYNTNSIVEFNGYAFIPLTGIESSKKRFYHSLKNLCYLPKKKMLLALGDSGNAFQLSPEYKKLKTGKVNAVSAFSIGDSLYMVTENGNIYLYNFESAIPEIWFIAPKNYPGQEEKTLTGCEQQGRILYMATSGGLYAINTASKKIVQLSDKKYDVIKKNPYNGKIYLSSKQQVDIIENNRVEHLADYKEKITFNNITDLCFINKNTWFISTTNGLLHIKKDTVHHYNKSNGFPFGYLLSLHYDSLNQSLFVGTLEKGLLKLQFKNTYSLYDKYGMPEGYSNSIIQTEDKQLITSSGVHLIELKEQGTAYYTNRIEDYASLASIRGDVYAGTWYKGLLIYKNGRLKDSVTFPNQLPNKSVCAAFEDSKGVIWIGTNNGLARGKNPADIKPVFSNDIKGNIICFYELRNGDLCVGSSNGAYIIRNDVVLKKLNSSIGFAGKEIRSFYEDDFGKVWIGSYGDGLYCYHKNTFISINAIKNCMLDKDVFCLAKDTFGYLNITSNHGLWKVSEKDLDDFYQKKLSYLVPFHYTEESGYLNTEFNGGFQNNYLKLEQGMFLFPGIEGTVISYPEKNIRVTHQPIISGVYINDTLVSKTNASFDRSTYSLQFDFYCVNLSSKNNVYFQHKLIGKTRYDWSVPQKQTSVSLMMLPPGKYTFMVRAISAFNEREPLVATYSFEIRPYFYETTWFRIVVATILCFIIIYIVRARVVSQRKKIEQKEHYKRKISEVELNAIQAQLNPHFIFNCMNTIKYFILEKDFTNANEGLNRLSKLIRNSLESSENMFMPLRQEVMFITNYVELEKMRLQDQLSYTIHISSDIDQHTLIPHLLIQPYIENAIKHGISNLEVKKGIMNIDFHQNKENIICTVSDNGIGREASGKLNTGTDRHFSKGTELSQDKSLLLNQYYGYKCTIEVIDLYDESGNSTGTKVKIEMSKTVTPKLPGLN